MATLTPKTISELPSASSLNNADLLALAQSGSSKSLSIATLMSAIETDVGTEFNLTGLTIIPVEAITGAQSNDTDINKLKAAVASGQVPTGTPFIGALRAGSQYFAAGYLYLSSSNLYGCVIWGTYNAVHIYKVNSGTYTDVLA